MKRKKFIITEADYIKANRKASRQDEISRHGRPVSAYRMVHKSRKAYDRNRMKKLDFIWNE